MTNQDRDPWKVLGIQPTSDTERIREAYLIQVRQHHPDQFRADATRYHQQEERMKTINQAYQLALQYRPASASTANPRHDPPVICPDHRYQAVRRCKRCQKPICLGCLGVRESLCNRHYQNWVLRRARGRALREWSPLIALVAGLRIVNFPPLYVGIAVLIYLAYLGLGLLLRKHWFGCLAVLLLPYSLVLAGTWSLLESIKEWSHAPQKVSKGH